MAQVHMILGSIVLLSYLGVVIGYLLATRGKTVSWVVMLSRAAAALLLVQYALGFGLLSSSDDRPGVFHYVLALSSIITVGFEHAVAAQEPDPAKRNRLSLMATLGTFILVLGAYMIGEMN